MVIALEGVWCPAGVVGGGEDSGILSVAEQLRRCDYRHRGSQGVGQVEHEGIKAC